ncbi:beta-lactamase family protein [Nocardioides sp. W3-2-3]|nr:beta-lactamase family protein [Nocardioides convexus]
MATYDVPGASVAVLTDGEVVEAAAGVVNLRTGVATTPDSPFQVQSVTKAVDRDPGAAGSWTRAGSPSTTR